MSRVFQGNVRSVCHSIAADMGINSNCFLFVSDVIFPNLLDEGKYSSCKIIVIYYLSGFSQDLIFMQVNESELYRKPVTLLVIITMRCTLFLSF